MAIDLLPVWKLVDSSRMPFAQGWSRILGAGRGQPIIVSNETVCQGLASLRISTAAWNYW